MTARDIVIRVVDALVANQLPYMLTGALDTSTYAVSRATKDADFVVQLAKPQDLRHLMDSLGPPFVLDPQIHFETITGSTCHRIHITGSRFFVELFLLGDDPFSRERFRRRKSTALFGRQVILPTAEDVVVQKLRWWRQGGRGKDRDDAAEVIASVGHTLDWNYIREWCGLHSTLDLLEQLNQRNDKT